MYDDFTGQTYYKKDGGNGTILVKCIDRENNFSLASNKDPEWVGYTNHRWGKDAEEWIEITEQEATRILESEI